MKQNVGKGKFHTNSFDDQQNKTTNKFVGTKVCVDFCYKNDKKCYHKFQSNNIVSKTTISNSFETNKKNM